METLVLAGIAIALLFNFMNGANDTSGQLATVIATRSLKAWQAVLLAAICNFAGPFLLTSAIARTIGTGILAPGALGVQVLVAGLVAAVILVFIATVWGFPLSSSHALVGGLVGAGLVEGGAAALLLPPAGVVGMCVITGILGAAAGFLMMWRAARWSGGDPHRLAISGAALGLPGGIAVLAVSGLIPVDGLLAIILFIVVAPALGFLVGFSLDVIISHLFRYSRQSRVRRIFRPAQVITSALQAVAHGSNDGQHAIGIIAALLLASGEEPVFQIPLWVIVAGAAAIAAGTSVGGWRVIDRVGRRITRIRPYQGFAASASGSVVVVMTTVAGVPISSTNAMNSAIVGVGATRGWKAVRWDTVRTIVMTWLCTIPLAAGLSACIYLGMHLLR
jgi:PiT family inorganic phosphate transporter